ncbi:MAG: UDP-2,3-diacylglucosamine diphosphatase [Gemmatimonadota bacterium]
MIPAAGLVDPPPALAPTVDRVGLADPVFISDLHLGADHPRTLDAFLRFMREAAPVHRELVILGDLFEYWAGDDDLPDPVAEIACIALAELARRGLSIFVMHGNRDLLLGRGFAQHVGATLLADPTVAEIGGRRVLLSHGDAYCTRDEPYQRFRAQARDPAYQRAFLARPLAERKAFIGQARAQSEHNKRMKAADIMDVTDDAIVAAMRAGGVTTMIHGHTHRPARHEFVLDRSPAQRLVLPDWDFDASPVRGGYLRFAGGEPVAEDFGP